MKIFIGAVVVAILAGSVFADYKWRQWMSARRAERDSSGHDPNTPDSR